MTVSAKCQPAGLNGCSPRHLAPRGGQDPLDEEANEVTVGAGRLGGGLTELAIWWSEHPDVPREQIVATAMNTVWIGFERVSSGEIWRPEPIADP